MDPDASQSDAESHDTAPPGRPTIEGTVADLAWVGGLFLVFFVLDRLTRGVAAVDVGRLGDGSLGLAALRSNPVPAALIAGSTAVFAVRHRHRWAARWSDLEHGGVLRLLAAPAVVLLAWQYSLYDVNFVVDRLHLADRLLVVALAVAGMWRPALLLPFALQVRIVASQFSYPFGTLAAQNIDELLVIATVSIAAVHVMYVVTGRDDTSPALLLLVAAVATHFWIPGRGKLELGWFDSTDLSNLPLNAYTAGWRGDGDGGWASAISGVVRSLSLPLRSATLLVELGAVVAAAHLRLARFWLVAAACFHVAVFASTGYWFLGWIVLELGLVVVLTRRDLAPWVARNVTPARGLAGVAVVVFAGSTLFHPPGLAWLDAPVSYGLEVDLVGVSGRRYAAPASMFAPNEQELTFLRLELDGRARSTGAYGAVLTDEEVQVLDGVESFAQLREIEGPPSADGADPRAVEWLRRFLVSLDERGRAPWSWAAPPDHFWTNRPAPTYSFQEPVRRLEVRRVRSIRDGDGQRLQRELIFSLDAEPPTHASTTGTEDP